MTTLRLEARPAEPEASLPVNLDDRCGEHFRYRDLVECGETWRRLAAASAPGAPPLNVPQAAGTFAALRALCVAVLDPVVRRFGPIELTYGFASRSLTRHVEGRIAPAIDQHAACEVDAAGRPVCARLGAAADVLVPGVDSREVAAWVARETAFDHLYFYGPDLPIHASAGPEESRAIVHLRRGPSGRRVPRVIGVEALLRLR
jgi:hypothetical protein